MTLTLRKKLKKDTAVKSSRMREGKKFIKYDYVNQWGLKRETCDDDRRFWSRKFIRTVYNP